MTSVMSACSGSERYHLSPTGKSCRPLKVDCISASLAGKNRVEVIFTTNCSNDLQLPIHASILRSPKASCYLSAEILLSFMQAPQIPRISFPRKSTIMQLQRRAKKKPVFS